MTNPVTKAGTATGLRVSFENVSRHYGPVRAVDNVNLTIEPGEFVSLLGPSGSGKTTLLMMLAGFDEPTMGRLFIGDRDVTRVPPNKRNIGMVFQKYALFPHMSVAENIAYPLKMRGIGRAERETQVERALDMVKLAGFGSRTPGQLSGGQQQRIALARAIVFNPQVILMDEPLGALDKKLRQHLQLEIKQLQERLGATVIFVTHDQEEALTMSDRIAVMQGGSIVQLGSPKDLYFRPKSAFVADFLGDMNFLPGRYAGESSKHCVVNVSGVQVSASKSTETAFRDGDAVRVAVRPESVTLTETAPGAPGLKGKISQLVFNGASTLVLVEMDAAEVTVQALMTAQTAPHGLHVGSAVNVTFDADAAHVYEDSV